MARRCLKWALCTRHTLTAQIFPRTDPFSRGKADGHATGILRPWAGRRAYYARGLAHLHSFLYGHFFDFVQCIITFRFHIYITNWVLSTFRVAKIGTNVKSQVKCQAVVYMFICMYKPSTPLFSLSGISSWVV